MTLNNERVLVTGGTGFIGSRLVRRLAEISCHVKVLTRDGTKAKAAPGVTLVRGDVSLPDTIRAATEGCQVVFHCAAGGGSLEEQRAVNVEGTRNVMAAAASAKARRVVHISSMAVHGHSLPDLVREDQALNPGNDPYALSKAEGEVTALQIGHQAGIEVVVIRPTLVYGPGSPTWTMSLFWRVKYGQVLLAGRGRGRANLVHVDDLVDAMLLGAEAPHAANQAFFINGGEIPTWAEYLGHFAGMLGKPSPPLVPNWRNWLEVQKGVYSYRFMRRPPRLTAGDRRLMTMHAVFSNEKAQEQLGYQPRITVAEGMERTREWLRRRGYLPSYRNEWAAIAARSK